MRFIFDETKAAQAASHLLRLNGGRMDYIVLIKLLYLADRRALVERGRPITGDALFSMPHGPVLSHVLDRIHLGANGEGTIWSRYVSDPVERWSVEVRNPDASLDALSRYEMRILAEVFEVYGALGKWALRDFTHTLPEWDDPHGSSKPIAPEDILRAEGKPDDEIEAVTSLANEVIFMHQATSASG